MADANRRIGIFGGTFNPVHVGHLVLAEQARQQGRLDEVRFVPTARPPHKQGQPLTPFARRLEMLALATAGHSAFRVDDMEESRPGPSYTADTLADLARREAQAELLLLLGSDCLPDLAGWHQPERIVGQVGLLVMARAGWPVWSGERLSRELGMTADVAVRVQAIEAPLVEISSRDLRQRVARGASIRYLVPRAVECYIQTHRLYLEAEPITAGA